MPPPTPLSVATKSVTRLLKEESSYRTELTSQLQHVRRLEEGHGNGGGDGENEEFELRQEKQAIEETKKVFGPLRERIEGAVEKLEGLLASGESAEGPEFDAANDALERARATM